MQTIVTLTSFLVALVFVRGADPRLDPEVLKTLGVKGSANIVVSFQDNDQSIKEIIHNHRVQSFPSRGEKAFALIQDLKAKAEAAQNLAVNALQKTPATQGKRITEFWITNHLFVAEADQATIDLLLGMVQVSRIMKEPIYHIEMPNTNIKSDPRKNPQPNEVQWGVEAIKAEAIWAMGVLGEGVVVGNIDTGVNGQHEALREGFRSSYGWYDPLDNSDTPTDENGHGTHCMGTTVGRTRGIGVAPQATWIACKACSNKGSCGYYGITSCGQWMVCPGNSSCEGIPQVVSNSYGGGEETDLFDHMIDVWIELGITPVFAAGNDGLLGCGSVGSPGTNPKVISVGNIDKDFLLASSSSRGPSESGRIQPDVAAPGTDILSAKHDDATGYLSMSGTSMATPHVAGLAALLYSKKSDLSPEQVRRYILLGTLPVNASEGETCGSTTNQVYPNNFVGHGRVDATKAWDHLLSSADALRGLVHGKTLLTLIGCVFLGTTGLLY